MCIIKDLQMGRFLRYRTTTLSNSLEGQIAAPNPTRVAISFHAHGSTAAFVYPGEATPAGNGMIFANQNSPITFTLRDFGSMVMDRWFGRVTTVGHFYYMTEVFATEEILHMTEDEFFRKFVRSG